MVFFTCLKKQTFARTYAQCLLFQSPVCNHVCSRWLGLVPTKQHLFLKTHDSKMSLDPNIQQDSARLQTNNILCTRKHLHYMNHGYSAIKYNNHSADYKLSAQFFQRRDISISPKAIVNSCPSKVQPYLRIMRLDRPIGTWLLFAPCLWSLTLASPMGYPDPYTLALFGLGAVLMRGAGCIVNDLWDKDIDAKVARTRTRPLPSGDLTQVQAIVLLGGTLSASLAILLQFNLYSIVLGASSLGLVITYPLMKRVTYWPQIILGLTFNWGALLGWSVVAGAVQWGAALPLYAGGIAWTLMYDTIYAHQDKEDDMLIGVKSTALRLGENTKPWLAGFSTAMVACLATSGVVCEQTWPYFAGVGVVATHLAHQIYTVDLDNPDDCFKKFCSNRDLGLIFWMFIIAGSMLKVQRLKKNTEVETEFES